MLYRTGLLTSLAYLMGERSVNATTTAPRADFLQKTLEECYQAYPWRFARTTTTLTPTSGAATMPADFDVSHPVQASYYSGDVQVTLTEVDLYDKGTVFIGDDACWLSANSNGTITLNTKDTVSSVEVTYQKIAPTLDSGDTIGTPYPKSMTLILGARRFVKLGQNPDADISQEQTQFDKSLSADIAAHQVPAPRRKRRTSSNITGDF